MKSGSQFVGWLSYFNDDSKKKENIVMEKITKEQIDEVIEKVTVEAGKNFCDILADYMQKYEDGAEKIGNPELKKNYKDYYHYYALISTSFKMSMDAIRESLYELLCEE